ncbi:DUF433 domain-containing protein [Phytoactinopolyspora alkaliphila]|uniref:DUF433 domain-containing protein n=1 Tax=Phytoactinopolyspora alkaliphila TaxID=1783498 RepID=A0A6N9YNM0_9ACTN|nr:DUF433 domain-containing protein [Phytoactinopolyspora alkaliphila]NED96429.1 DUF433 domain-containing protein [Phytoactinopolyspora alkaliphila]
MAFPQRLASVLTGATYAQLNRWRDKGLVIPEVRPYRPPLYSFRDLILLRSLVRLRASTSMQKVSKAFRNLDLVDLTEHPSEYKFGTDGKTVYAGLNTGEAIDLTNKVGQIDFFTFEQLIERFKNFRDEEVVNFRHPSKHVEVKLQRMGGWPTISGTRVPYDTIADLVDYRTVFPKDVPHFYPTVSAEAAEDAVRFQQRVEAVAG